MQVIKKWYNSRLIQLGGAAVLSAVADGVLHGWGWRQIVWTALGALVVVLRVDTTKAVGK